MSEVTEGFLVDVTHGVGRQGQDHGLVAQGIVSMRSVLQIDLPNENAMVWEAGAGGNGCVLYIFDGKLYFKGGNGSTVTGGNRSAEVQYEIPSAGEYDVEISFSTAANRVAMFINGSKVDQAGPGDGSLLNPVAGGNPMTVGTPNSSGWNYGSNGVPSNRYAGDTANDFNDTQAGPEQVGSFVGTPLTVFQGQSTFDLNPSQNLRVRYDFADSRSDNGVLRDRTSFDNHAQISGTPAFGDTTPPIGEAVDTGGNASFEVPVFDGLGAGSIAIVTWIWIRNASTVSGVVAAREQSWSAGFDSGSMFFTNLEPTNFGQQNNALVPISLPEEEWVHLAWIYTEGGGTFRVAKGGEVVNFFQGLSFPLEDAGDNLFLASDGTTSTRFDGKIADFRVYDRPIVGPSVNRIRKERSLTSTIDPGLGDSGIGP